MATFTGHGIPPRRLGNLGRLSWYSRITMHSSFHSISSRRTIQPYLLADIGEGITECRVIQWFVKVGDKVNQFDAICEIQSDKASVEITSRYDGTITALHHQVDDMAIVGQPLLDIDVDDTESDGQAGAAEEPLTQEVNPAQPTPDRALTNTASLAADYAPHQKALADVSSTERNSGQVMPAVRRMLKDHDVDLRDITGTGKGGRVLKEDVQQYLNSQTIQHTPMSTGTSPASDRVVPLTPTESQMFKVMTNALSIPHFGFTHSVDMTCADSIRRKCNKRMDLACEVRGTPVPKLTFLPIIMKALSMAFQKHPKLNSHLEFGEEHQKPRLILKGSHNFGFAVDTPNGLLVPVVKDIQDRSVMSIAEELNRLNDLAKKGTLKPSDFTGATFTVSNIGSIGGNVVSPIIAPPMVGIVGIGKIDDVPVLVEDGEGHSQIVKRRKTVLSWSADHRVLDGASVARCASLVSTIMEDMDGIGIALM